MLLNEEFLSIESVLMQYNTVNGNATGIAASEPKQHDMKAHGDMKVKLHTLHTLALHEGE